jgi:hypothetical protein
MTSDIPKHKKPLSREERMARALRENLKRRKEQKRHLNKEEKENTQKEQEHPKDS